MGKTFLNGKRSQETRRDTPWDKRRRTVDRESARNATTKRSDGFLELVKIGVEPFLLQMLFWLSPMSNDMLVCVGGGIIQCRFPLRFTPTHSTSLWTAPRIPLSRQLASRTHNSGTEQSVARSELPQVASP